MIQRRQQNRGCGFVGKLGGRGRAAVLAAWSAVLAAILAGACARAASSTIRLEYELRILRPTTHLAEVEINAGDVREPFLDFCMPAWSPGRYAIYNFAKNVQNFQATDASGHALVWTQTDKQTWRVARPAGASGAIRVRYEVYGNDLNGSFSQIDSTHANLNGASVFLYVAGHKRDPIELRVEAPVDWKLVSGFSLTTDARQLEAPNYDRLIDTPIELAPSLQIATFDEGGKTFRVAVHADGQPTAGSGSFDPPGPEASGEFARLVEGLKKIVASEMGMMPAPDFDHYTFIIHFAPDIAAGDGMEHLNSTQIIVAGGLSGDGVKEALEGAAHEFFHVWNVKRLRPAALGPFDYRHEDYTPSLWLAEGVTQYYSSVHLLRAGLWSRDEFLKRLAGKVRALEQDPGRSLMSVEQSSFDAWYYDRAPQMQETNFANSTISYYDKGALLGLLLDLQIRARTQGRKSLDDVMRLMYERFYNASAASYYLPGRGYKESDILAAVNEVSGNDFADFFNRYVHGVEPLPYRRVLAEAGLDLRIETKTGAPPSLGVIVRPADNGVRIADVLPGGAADRAGLSRDDVLVAVDELSLATQPLATRLAMYPPGARVPFTVERHLRELRITVQLDPPIPDEYSIVTLPGAAPDEVRVRDRWLGERH